MAEYLRKDNEDLMSTLCRLVVETRYADLPSEVIDFAKKHILDTIGVTIGGSLMEGIPEIVRFVKDQGGREDSHIPLYGGKVPAAMCAFALAPMARAMDMGDVHEEAGHSAEYTLPALLAATGLKSKISGKELITSFVLGQEVLIRIGKAYKWVSLGTPAGTHGGHYIFGPVASVSKLLGLDLEQTEHAQSMAKCMTQPHDMSMYSPATLMVRVHHGFIAQDAVNVCLLAKRSFTGPRLEVLNGQKGFYSLFANGLAESEIDIGTITENLGEEWEMTKTMLKSYPSCNCTHASIEGILDQMRKYRFKFQDIESVHLDESRVNWMIVCEPYEVKWNPRTVPECQFSLPYTVATAAVDGTFFLDSYAPEKMFRREVRSLMMKISAREDADLPPLGARVTTRLKDGTVYTGEYIYIKGHPENAFTEKELIKKFKKCALYSAYELDSVIIDSLVERILNLEEVEDVVEDLVLPLVPLKMR